MQTLKSVLFIAMGSVACQLGAGEPFPETARGGIVATFSLSDLKERTSSFGVGINAGWGFWKASENSEVGLYLEHRVYSGAEGRTHLSDLGVDLRSRLYRGFYDRFGLSAERVESPGNRETIKLGGVFGVGYRFDGPLGIELYSTHLASSKPASSTVNLSLIWYF